MSSDERGLNSAAFVLPSLALIGLSDCGGRQVERAQPKRIEAGGPLGSSAAGSCAAPAFPPEALSHVHACLRHCNASGFGVTTSFPGSS